MTLLSLLLALLPVGCNFIDFLVGTEGDKVLRTKLFNYYYRIETDWRSVFQEPAKMVSEFLYAKLGVSSAAYLLRVSLYSCFISAFVWLNFAIRLHGSELTVKDIVTYSPALLQIVIIPCLIGDIVSWWSARRILREVGSSGALRAVFLLMLLTLVSCMAVQFVVVAQSCSGLFLSADCWHYTRSNGLSILYYSDTSYLRDAVRDLGFFNFEQSGTGLFYLDIDLSGPTPVLPLIPLFLTIMAAGVPLAIYPFQNSFRPILTGLLARLEAYPKNILTLAATLFASLPIIIGIFVSYLHTKR